MKRIIIVGGGFAGIALARSLANKMEFDITLVDKNNYNYFTPLIYQVATGFLEPSSIAYPFRNLLIEKKNLHFRMGKLQEIVPSEKKIILDNGELFYEDLVIATGTRANFFGLEKVKKFAIPMNSLNDALNMRNTILLRVEKASRSQDLEERKRLLTIVIAGGGPTGVEVSGMFAEMRNTILAKEYPELSPLTLKIYLVSSSDNLLAPFSKKAQDFTLHNLKNMGVDVLLNTRVNDYDGENVILNNGNKINSASLIWATGVISYSYTGIPKESYGHGNRLKVDGYNQVEGLDNVYAIGDTSIQTTDENFPTGHPQLAQVALQQGKNLARNFRKMHAGESLQKFNYNDKGIMAVVSKSKAVADISQPKFKLTGFVAWLLWAAIHLFSLINRHDRIRTFYDWTLNYFSDHLDLRMILRPTKNP